MKFILRYLFFSGMICLAGCAGTQQLNKTSDGLSVKWIQAELNSSAKQYGYLATQVPDGVMPRSFVGDKFNTCNSTNWTAGFYPGTLLYLYEATGEKSLYEEAQKKVVVMNKEQYNTGTHDLGFMMYCSYGNLNRIDPTAAYKQILVNSANALSTRFNPKVGCIRSWGSSDDSTNFNVIIDNMMNLELLFWAAKQTGNKKFYKIAVTHANKTMLNHFRPDFSSYHVVNYDPKTGKVISRKTAQGAADGSAWARGQSWGLYGYTMMYRETKDKKYLKQAQNIATFILTNPNLPADKIPYWDYNAPNIPEAFRDASSAAIMASALLELADYSDTGNAKNYRAVVKTILQTLSSPEYKAGYKENGGFLLKHNVAHLPKNTEVDSALPYADYYYVEALLRYKTYLKGKTVNYN